MQEKLKNKCTINIVIEADLCTMETMRMKIIAYIKKAKSLTNYGVAKALRGAGVDITTQAIDQYEKEEARSMRLDVLVGLRKLSDLTWPQFGKLLEDDFGSSKKS